MLANAVNAATRRGPSGKREQAREHLTTATTMYRPMEMRVWLEQAEMVRTELA